SSRRRHTRLSRDWSSDVCSSDLGLRATGCDFDIRKARPYSGYQHFEFEVPLAVNGDAYDRCMVKMGEMRESLKIIEQCLQHMPEIGRAACRERVSHLVIAD